LEINNRLPAPFDLKDNTASEGKMQITYRIPAGVSVGYLELLNSPYNFEKIIMIVAGNTDQGLGMAGNTLVQANLTSQLAGLFAVSNGTKVATSVTSPNFSIVGDVVPGAEVIINQPILPVFPAASKTSPPAWLMPLLSISALMIVVVLGYVIGTAILRRRSPKIDATAEKADVD
jgi:hypothetical protein